MCIRDSGCELVGRHERDPITAPEPPWVIPACWSRAGQQSHVLVGRGDQLGAEDGLEQRASACAAPEPAPGELQGARKRPAVEAIDDLEQPILVVALDRTLELPHPGA